VGLRLQIGLSFTHGAYANDYGHGQEYVNEDGYAHV
jgi:hypothetical protein